MRAFLQAVATMLFQMILLGALTFLGTEIAGIHFSLEVMALAAAMWALVKVNVIFDKVWRR